MTSFFDQKTFGFFRIFGSTEGIDRVLRFLIGLTLIYGGLMPWEYYFGVWQVSKTLVKSQTIYRMAMDIIDFNATIDIWKSNLKRRRLSIRTALYGLYILNTFVQLLEFICRIGLWRWKTCLEPISAHVWTLVLLVQWLAALQRCEMTAVWKRRRSDVDEKERVPQEEKAVNKYNFLSQTAELGRNLQNVAWLEEIFECSSCLSGVLAIISNVCGFYKLIVEQQWQRNEIEDCKKTL